MQTKIKIFGERNTSTNALKALIKKNSESHVLPSVAGELDPNIKTRLALAKRLRVPVQLREGMIDRVFARRGPLETWKHAATYFDDPYVFSDVHVVFCVRHPASWLLGLFRNPYHVFGPRPQSLKEFLNHRWKTVGRERLGRAETSAIPLYNQKLAAFSDLQKRLSDANLSYSVVRQEDFAVDQAEVFARLAPYLARPAAQFEALEASTKDKTKTIEYYKNYYGQEQWRDEIDADSAARIDAEVDWPSVASLGYRPH